MLDVDEVRRKAMELLEQEVGGPVAAAKRVGMSYAQWANLRSGARDIRSGKPRGMRKETAWRIEEAFNKPRGWLNMADLVDPNFPRESDDAFSRLIRAWNLAGDNDKEIVEAWANAVLSRKPKRK